MEQHTKQGEIVMYQPDETIRLEVRLENDTVWLTQAQMAELFQKDQSVIARHIANVFREGELQETSNMQILHNTLSKFKPTKVYNLNVIISVGYRVKSKRGTQFRIWATSVLKELLLRGYAINQQLSQLERRIDARFDTQQNQIKEIKSTLADHQQKIDFFVRTNQPPVEGVLFEGQIFDAYKLVEALVKSAQREIILIDNYIDATVFDLLEKREQGVDATIYTEHVSQSLTHLQQLNQQQYGRRIEVKEYNNRFHDRFLILDDALYHFGASFKDLGKRLFAFEQMGIDKEIILNQL
nr:RhuM family protein [Prevotella sp. tc2-28]